MSNIICCGETAGGACETGLPIAKNHYQSLCVSVCMCVSAQWGVEGHICIFSQSTYKISGCSTHNFKNRNAHMLQDDNVSKARRLGYKSVWCVFYVNLTFSQGNMLHYNTCHVSLNCIHFWAVKHCIHTIDLFLYMSSCWTQFSF